jgi:5-methylcytosine-specific restriction enzyme A
MDKIEKEKCAGKKRSREWPKVRKAYLKEHPKCFVCLGTKKLNVHHCQVFHLHPELELDPKNLITLCENDKGGINCHLAFGHLGSFKSWNENVREDTKTWRLKILNRPQ